MAGRNGKRDDGNSGAFVRHGRIADHLRGQIVRGRISPGDRLPTQLELQRRFGTTPVTVQRAFDCLSAEGFIGAKSNQGSFVAPHPPHLWHYAMLFDDAPRLPDKAMWSRFHEALVQVARNVNGLGPRQIQTYFEINGHADSDDYARLIDDMDTGRIAGLIFPFAPHELLKLPPMARRGVPRVARNFHDGYLPLVGPGAGFLDTALAWLKSQGRRRVAVVTLPQINSASILEAIARSGLSSAPFWTHAVEPHHTGWVLHAVHAILHSSSGRRMPDALIVTDDHLVEAVADALVKLRVRVPRDILVVGHWNFPLRYTRPDVPVRLLGVDNTDLLRRWIATIDAQRRKTRVPPRTEIGYVWQEDPMCAAQSVQDLPAPHVA